LATDFNNIDSIIGAFTKVLNLSSLGGPPKISSPIIFLGVPMRTGLSPTKIASKIISRKSEAGLPVGALPSGAVSPDEIMWRIAIEEIINAFQQNAVISVAIPPGISVTAAGISAAGPVTVQGMTTAFIKGYGIIQ